MRQQSSIDYVHYFPMKTQLEIKLWRDHIATCTLAKTSHARANGEVHYFCLSHDVCIRHFFFRFCFQ